MLIVILGLLLLLLLHLVLVIKLLHHEVFVINRVYNVGFGGCILRRLLWHWEHLRLLSLVAAHLLGGLM